VDYIERRRVTFVSLSLAALLATAIGLSSVQRDLALAESSLTQTETLYERAVLNWSVQSDRRWKGTALQLMMRNEAYWRKSIEYNSR
jgi:hypothetical protein